MVHRHHHLHDHYHRLLRVVLGGPNTALKVFFFCATLFGLYGIRLSTTTTTSTSIMDVEHSDYPTTVSSIMDLPLITLATINTASNMKKYLIKKKIKNNNNNEDDEDRDNNDDNDNDNDIVLKRFKEANITLSEEQKQQLPTWSQITNQYGSKPKIVGLDKCTDYQQRIPIEKRKLGIAGMSSTGTNLIFITLKNNCIPPPDLQTQLGKNYKKKYKGIKWQVPWGKHDPLLSQIRNVSISRNWNVPDDIKQLNDTDSILTLVMIRHPYRWFQSVCSRSYVIDLFPEKFTHSQKMSKQRKLPCPYIINTTTNISHPIGYNTRAGKLNYSSLAHAWNEWNNEYLNPIEQVNLKTRLMVRMEDLIFHTYDIIKDICDCMGLVIRDDRPFQYEETTVKSKHNGTSKIGMVGAYEKFGNPPQSKGGLETQQYNAAREYLDTNLMDIFNYHHPPSSSSNE